MNDKEFSLVSLITPCYNGEKHIGRLLNSILEQTYPNIEHYVIDDGSTDNTADVIKSYIEKYEAKGYSLTYVFQNNSGQSVAINNGLKLIKGEYLLWPDSDDYYSCIDSISILIDAISSTDDSYGIVRCFLEYENENSSRVYRKHSTTNPACYKENFFREAVFGSDCFWYVPGGFVLKVSHLRKILPDFEIFTHKEAGQNYQLLLPILFNYKCKTIGRFLYRVIEKENSHSRIALNNCNMRLRQEYIYKKTLEKTIERIKMGEEDKNKLMEEIDFKYMRSNCYIHATFQRKEFKPLFKKMCFTFPQYISYKDYITYYLYRLKILPFLSPVFNFIRQLLK